MKIWMKRFVNFLVLHDVLTFGRFKLKSGRISPYYFNLRKIGDGEALSTLAAYYTRKIVEDIGIDAFDTLFGPSYAGIPLVVGIANELWKKHKTKKRYAFDRKEKKIYGDSKDRIIAGGSIANGDRILIIDDVVTTADTKVECERKLKSLGLGLHFVGVLVAFDRLEVNEKENYAGRVLAREKLKLFSILDAPSTFAYLSNRKICGKVYVTEPMYKMFQEYFKKYGLQMNEEMIP